MGGIRSRGLHTCPHHTGSSDVRRPAELTSDEYARQIHDVVRDNDLYLVAERILDGLAQILELFGLVLASLLLILRLLEFKALFAHADELLAIKLFQLSDGILIDRINEQQRFEALLLENLEERGIADRRKRLASEVVDRFLDLGHTRDIVCKSASQRQPRIASNENGPAYP